jgi:hypothetical protein
MSVMGYHRLIKLITIEEKSYSYYRNQNLMSTENWYVKLDMQIQLLRQEI